jgi:diguanylate cyclase (GGDEF)-like protein
MLDAPDAPRAVDWAVPFMGIVEQLSQHIQSYAGCDNTKHHVGTESLALESCYGSAFNSTAPLIYICDDEPDQVDYLVHQLGCLGYQVKSFTQTAKFRKAVMKQRPDAVIMDVYFPQGHTGTEELASIKEATGRELPAIVLSNSNSFESRLSAVRAGCVAYFTKPASPMSLAAALDELVEYKEEEPYRILIVDDEPEIAEYHSLILEDAGMLTQQIYDPSMVFETLKDFSPDLMLIDMYMPVCNGDELAALVRQFPEYVGLPIVFLSTETNAQKQFKAMRAGVEGFITKPVVPDELVASITLRAERMRTLRSLMVRDSLTGLYNHTTTTEMLISSIANAKRQQESLVMVMIDLDAFKSVNDTYGHMAGDQVIVALSRMFKHRLRSTDVIGRYGGEEFAFLLKDIPDNLAEVLVNEMREDFSKIIFNVGSQSFTCTFSAGISMYPEHANSEDLRMAADTALYLAKEQGRNQVVISRKKYE